MPTGVALIADSDHEHTTLLAEHIREHGWGVETVESIAQVREMVAGETPCNVLITSLDLAGEPVESLFEEQLLDDLDEVIIMSGADDPQRVSNLTSQGASYFFCKPFDGGFFSQLIEDLNTEFSRDQPVDIEVGACHVDQFGSMRGNSKSMQRLFRILRKVAPTDASVLLIGESGTGKELAAQTIHQMSQRTDAPLVAMNCGAIPSELVESELFGHMKGAFTGADKNHQGFFERADKATLFLDEITEMPLEIQVKLLRVLETGKFRRVGGEQDLSSDVRIIAATNRAPQQALSDGVLREDLYYRIASFPITIPPLRKRKGDIGGLAQYFLDLHNDANETEVLLSAGAIEKLNEYGWPGNVRELKSAIERAYVMGSGFIGADELILDALQPVADDDTVAIPVGTSIENAERQLIEATLEELNGDKEAAAETLGISLKTLYNRLNEYKAG